MIPSEVSVPRVGSKVDDATKKKMAVTDENEPSGGARHHSGMTTDEVTDRLRELILSGSFAPSEWLRESDLANALKVSRTPVREALKRLADEQLVEREVNRGSRVRPMTLEDAIAVYVVRESLEGLAARAAALAQPPDLLARLRALEEEMSKPGKSAQELAGLNIEFHRAIRHASGNVYLERFLLQVEHAVRRFGSSTFESLHRVGEIHDEHRAIVEAIEAGDPDAAERNASHHIRKALDARVSRLLRGMNVSAEESVLLSGRPARGADAAIPK